MKEKAIRKRPKFPKRAVITAGMPYGNKALHFGHVGGVFIHADVFARFLRDRIGSEHVIFVSGTDCYGSPIVESYRKACEHDGYEKSIEEYVKVFHEQQKETLSHYDIVLDCFGASAFGDTGKVHQIVSEEIFEQLYHKGWLKKMSSGQFYDETLGTLLNGRQVEGKCPIDGCTSEKAYADECSLGHQYAACDLIDPISLLSNTAPIRKEIENWYFDLEPFRKALLDYNEYLKEYGASRKYLLKTIEEFLKPPVIYVQRKRIPDRQLIDGRIAFKEIIDEDKKPSISYVFNSLKERDNARMVLDEQKIPYRTGKTLVPFRLTGNVKWGIPAPEKENMKDLTFWVWPESLWAPISFLRSVLKQQGCEKDWPLWWQDEDSSVYQFIGEDNIYFYGIAQQALFTALESKAPHILPMKELHLTTLIPNRHVLFLNQKAGSSSTSRPPMAEDLLKYYSADQLRMHFLSLGLSTKSVSFEPAALQSEVNGQDPVTKQGNLLTNVMNRLVRSCLYLAQDKFEGRITSIEISKEIKASSDQAVLDYEWHMSRQEFHRVIYVLDDYIRRMNKHWSNEKQLLSKMYDARRELQLYADVLHAVRTAAALLHPIAPDGCHMIQEYLNVEDMIWDWDYIFSPLWELVQDPKNHTLRYLEPRIDFFTKPQNYSV